MSEKTQVSVIIPVYRTQDFLARCVESVLSQTMTGWEMILVDDGSPDGCPALCDSYAAEDSRIHVIHQENQGLSAARNAALDWMQLHSESSWLTFLDSDDWLHPGTLEALVRAAVEHRVPVAVCQYAETHGETPSVPEELPRAEVWKGEDFFRRNYGYATVACAKLYHRDCFREERFPVGRLHEDEFVTYRILAEQGTLAYLPAPLYFYYYNVQGITKSGWNPRRMDALEAFRQQCDYFLERGNPQLAGECLRRGMQGAYFQLRQLRQMEDSSGFGSEMEALAALSKQWARDCHRMKSLNFVEDFGVLREFFPVRTTLYMYWQAVLRRLGRK